MLASELIKKLQEEIDEDGDLPVYIDHCDEDGEEWFNPVTNAESVMSIEHGEVKPTCIRIMDYID